MAANKPNECDRLARVLVMYEATSWRVVSRYITYLTGTAVVLIFLGVGALATPRRLAPRVMLAALMFAMVSVLVPYFILDTRRATMVLSRYKIENRSQLNQEVAKCKTNSNFSSIKLKSDITYGYGMESMWWEGLSMIACTLIAAMLTSRLLYISISRRFDNNQPSGRLLINLPIPSQFSLPNRDINAALALLRASAEDRGKWRDTQCAICLENLDEGDVSILNCTHAYHEGCLASWLRFSNARGKCPMCKTSVWKDDTVDVRPNSLPQLSTTSGMHEENRSFTQAPTNENEISERRDQNSDSSRASSFTNAVGNSTPSSPQEEISDSVVIQL